MNGRTRTNVVCVDYAKVLDTVSCENFFKAVFLKHIEEVCELHQVLSE